MTRLLRYSQTAFLPNFVLLLDADEFISAKDREALTRALDAIPRGGAGLMPWRTFVHAPGENGRSGEDPPRSFRYRRAIELPLYRKAVLRLDGTYRPELQIEPGNHAIRTLSGEQVPTVLLDDLPLLHFPLRSRNQVIAKIVVGSMAHSARNPAAHQRDPGLRWHDAFDRIAAGSASLTDVDLCEMSMRYAQDRAEIDWSRDVVEEEPPSNYVRRYSTTSFADPIALIARSWKRSLVASPPSVHIEPPSSEPPISSNAASSDDLFGSPDYWDRFFVSPDPWGHSSEYEITKRGHTLSVIPWCERGLELACAEGHFTALLGARVRTLVASDISAVPLERAARRCDGMANIAFQKLDFVRDPIPGQFDLIVCSEVLYYLRTIERLHAVMRKLVEALAPGGLLVMTHPNMVSDDPDQTGFDWVGHSFGAKTIGDMASHLGGLVLEQELRTPLYRVQRFRRVYSGMSEQPPIVVELPLSMPLDRRLERGIVWEGAIRTREAALRDEHATTLPILCYHRIAENGPEALAPYRIHPRAFEKQVRWLRRHGYYSVSIAQWAEAMQRNVPLLGRPVLFTFDDGYRDFGEVAWPILDRHGFSALVFIVTGKVGGSAVWDADLGEPALLMGWEEIRQLLRDGVDFGSHSVNHLGLDSLAINEVIEECTSSRATLEERLERSISAISYPWGVYNQDVCRSAVECGYSVAVTTRPGRAQLTDDRMALPRIQIFSGCSLRNFADLVNAVVTQDAASSISI
jgi:peptidoglycan/xylan/chitin deacetylase (PgdA/CDA1 family)